VVHNKLGITTTTTTTTTTIVDTQHLTAEPPQRVLGVPKRGANYYELVTHGKDLVVG